MGLDKKKEAFRTKAISSCGYSVFVPTIGYTIGTILDFHGTLFNELWHTYSLLPDSEAMRSDWVVVGNDISHAINKYKEEELVDESAQ